MRPLVEFATATSFWRWLLALGFVHAPALASAEVRRALLVGINTYAPPTAAGAPVGGATGDRGWTNLEGSLNDVEGMRALLVGRFGFAPRNVVVLQDSAATRRAILAQIRQHLLAPAQRGDVCVFYFAGHGSRVFNSKSDEADHFDETIVPADANRGTEAGRDIRDKEVAHLFNDILDRGALLTAFFDCCHSGSISRGLGSPARLRRLHPDMRDVAASDTDPRGVPADRGALVFSASQETQKAAEIADAAGQPHGVFSFMLAKTLRSVPPGEPAGRVVARVRALVAASETGQSPAVAASTDRLAAPLFGGKAAANDQLVLAMAARFDKRCRIQGGSAVGLYPGCELVPVRAVPAAAPSSPPRLRLRIDSIEGPGTSTAVCVAGDLSTAQPGDLFEVDRWVAAPDARLRFWTPAALAPEALLRAVAEFGKLARAPRVRWITDPTEETPTHVVSWNGTSWMVSGPSNAPVEVPVSASRVLEVVAGERSANTMPALFVLIPPSPALLAGLPLDAAPEGAPTQLVRKENEAQYLLAGRIEQGQVEYAWAARNATRSDLEGRTSLPARTNWFRTGKAPETTRAVADSLQGRASRLARVQGWLQLDSPPGVRRFPYHLVIRGRAGTALAESSVVHKDEALTLSLEAAPRDLELGSSSFYVYVFTIDSNGKSTLLFPRDENSGNYLPEKSSYSAGIPPARIALTDSALVSDPFGTDTYVLLTSKEPLESPRQVLEFDGVRETPRTRGADESSPLATFLMSLTTRTRGARVATPATWSVERLAILSQP